MKAWFMFLSHSVCRKSITFSFIIHLMAWSALSAPYKTDVKLDGPFTGTETLTPFDGWSVIQSMTLSADIELPAADSLVRAVLVDTEANEYLIYEVYPLLTDKTVFSVTNVCEETCTLPPIAPESLRIEIVNAKVSGITLTHPSESHGKCTHTTHGKLKKIKAAIAAKRLKWRAGDTQVSRLSYAQKKRFFGGDVPNLQGFEYYKGGIFKVVSSADGGGAAESVVPSTKGSQADGADTDTLITHLDWREKHHANDPASPYYDNDPTGSGWFTPVKTQSCNHCWVFAAVHITEALVNLYYNHHIDIDLSEQAVASCSGAHIGTCEDGGYLDGYPSALSYIREHGVVEETCYSYVGTQEPCNVCMAPADRIQVSSIFHLPNNDEMIKRALIENGPITGGFRSLWHFLVLIGFDQDPETGETIWLVKNSYGDDWGENGFGRMTADITDLYGLNVVKTPIISQEPYPIRCLDADGDGYYNWGLSEDPPGTCPPDIPAEKDCNDADPAVFLLNANGHCLPGQCQADADCDDNDNCTTDICRSDLTCNNIPISGCGDCSVAAAPLTKHQADGRAYSIAYQDCSACWYQCQFPMGCAATSATYFALGSDESLGSAGEKIVTLYSSDSRTWTRAGCDPTDRLCDGKICDDGLICNGMETCTAGECIAGTPVDCKDDDECTIDQCDEENDVCASIPDPLCGTCLSPWEACSSDTQCCSNDCSRGVFVRRCQ